MPARIFWPFLLLALAVSECSQAGDAAEQRRAGELREQLSGN